jgi:hypothetical protein
VFAQHRRWVKGYIVKLNFGDTTRGYILKNWRGSTGPRDDSIMFKPGRKDSIRTFNHEDLVSFTIRKNEHYLAIVIHEDTRPDPRYLADSCIYSIHWDGLPDFRFIDVPHGHVYASLKSPDIDSLVDRPVFAHVLMRGTYYSVFETFDTKNRFFVAFGGNNLYAEEMREYHIITPYNGRWTIDHFKVYLQKHVEYYISKGLFPQITARQISHLTKTINEASYDEYGITSIIREINSLQGGKVLYLHNSTPPILPAGPLVWPDETNIR